MIAGKRIHLLLLLISVFVVITQASNHWNLKQWRDHCGTKSPYNRLGDTSKWKSPPKSCKPYHFTLVARHGSRYCCLDSDEELQALINFRDMNKKLIKKRLQNGWLGDYVLPAPVTRNKQLFKAGMFEHFSFAQRYRDAFPSLLSIKKNGDYDPDIIKASSTQESRTGMSGSSFLYGILQGSGPIGGFQPYFMPARSTSVDSILHFSDTCDQYNAINSDPSTQTERNAYLDSILPTLIQKLQNELSNDVNNPVNISSTDVLNLYAGCYTDIYMRNVSTEWCSLWNKDMGKMMDYYNDIDTYYDVGPGVTVNAQMASNLVQDIFYHLDQKIANNTDYFQEKANLYFAHAETVIPLLSVLGFFNSTPTLTRTPPTSKYNFISAKIGCMATHAVIVTYDCGTEFKVGFGVNEKQEIFPGCTDLFCSYSQVKQILNMTLSASWPDICAIGSNDLCLDVSLKNIKHRTLD